MGPHRRWIRWQPGLETWRPRHSSSRYAPKSLYCTMNQEAAKEQPGDDGIYYRAAEGTYDIPPELKRITMTRTSAGMNWIDNPEAIGLDLFNFQSDPSRIIYHGGRYHMWMLDMDRSDDAEYIPRDNPEFFETAEGKAFRPKASRILYLSSDDTYRWTAHNHLPLGPEGSCYDLLLEQVNVVCHESRFYMFTEVWTTNVEKYGRRQVGITCLVADTPGGPWTRRPRTRRSGCWC